MNRSTHSLSFSRRAGARNVLLGLVACLIVVGAPPVGAQSPDEESFERIRPKPPERRQATVFDPSLNCNPLPPTSPDPYEVGLVEALALAERRALTLETLGATLDWAVREPDVAYVPALKRLVEEYLCWWPFAHLAFLAIEATGEPSEYFVRYAQDWRRNDKVAERAMETLGGRGDSTVNRALRAIAMEAPRRANFGSSMQLAYNAYGDGIRYWDRFRRWPIDDQLFGAVRVTVPRAVAARKIPGYDGDLLSFEWERGLGYGHVVPQRQFLLLAESYPTAMTAAIEAYRDSFRTRFPPATLASEYKVVYDTNLERIPREIAFGKGSLRAPPALSRRAASEKRGTISVRVCTADIGGMGTPSPWTEPYEEGTLAAEFSYTSQEPEAIRVAYGPDNSLTVPTVSPGPFAPVPPEVFFPDGSRTYSGLLRPRAFRVAFRPGESVTWTLLGQPVTADATTPRCEP